MDELVKRLRTTKVTVYKMKDLYLLDEAADAIEELAAKNATTEWHSVEDELPMCGQRCLVVMLRDDGETSVETAYCYVQNYGYWSDTGPRRKVTYWMPLPGPPKEGK